MNTTNSYNESTDTKAEVFNWPEYLDRNNAVDVPYTLFKHVEQSLDSGIRCGMAVEAPHGSSDETCYWPAIIIKICGPMITLRYLGATANSKHCDVWSDIASLRYIGYSETTGIPLKPPACLNPVPEELQEKISLGKEICRLPAVPKDILSKNGKCAIDRISSGMIVGVRDVLDPNVTRNAEIIYHNGGRLFLKTLEEPEIGSWIFYTDRRIVEADNEDITLRLPADLLMKYPKIEQHSFELGMQLEMLNPRTRTSIYNGVVSQVIDNQFFIATIIDKNGDYDTEFTTNNSWLCSFDHPYIFPVGWASINNLQIIQSNEINSEACTYKEMFSTKANAQLLGFQAGMKLEAVHPNNPNAICVATIISIHEHLLCIVFDHEVQNQLMKSYYVHCQSNEIFPIYWCGTNNYELVCPVDIPESSSPMSREEEAHTTIYFNYKCRTGPMYSHKKISQLPVSVGPGEVSQVLKKVLNLIVSEAYQPLRLLRLLGCDEDPGPGRTLVEIKASTYNNAKEKVTVRANVDVVTRADDVAEYCREICKALQACPYLFGPQNINNKCPEDCTGDKNGNTNDKVRPKYKKKGRRGLHFKTIQAQARRLNQQTEQDKESDSDSPHASDNGSRPNTPLSMTSIENENNSIESAEATSTTNEINSQTKENKARKRKRNVSKSAPKIYEMKTRGAKLPNFALQIKQGHWYKKDVETIYKKTLRIPKKKPRFEYITETESDLSDSTVDNETNGKSGASDISQSDISKNEDSNMNEMSFNSVESVSLTDIKEENEESMPMPCLSPKSSVHNHDSLIYTNPLHWSVDDLHGFLKQTNCWDLAAKLKEEDIDGQAFMMLNLPFVQEYLNLKYDSASRLCEHVAKVKLAFFVGYVN